MRDKPYEESKWMTDYISFEKAETEKEMVERVLKMLDSKEHLKQVIADQDEKIDRLEGELYELKAHWTLRLKWKIATLLNKIPRYTIKIERK